MNHRQFWGVFVGTQDFDPGTRFLPIVAKGDELEGLPEPVDEKEGLMGEDEATGACEVGRPGEREVTDKGEGVIEFELEEAWGVGAEEGALDLLEGFGVELEEFQGQHRTCHAREVDMIRTGFAPKHLSFPTDLVRRHPPHWNRVELAKPETEAEAEEAEELEKELKERVREIDAGEVEMIPGKEAWRRLFGDLQVRK